MIPEAPSISKPAKTPLVTAGGNSKTDSPRAVRSSATARARGVAVSAHLDTTQKLSTYPAHAAS
eukprot:334522-Pyramimonas_sp.AAC.1